MNKLMKNTLNLLPKINLREKVHIINHQNLKAMRKIMFAVMAMIAIGFTSCGNKAQAPAEAAAEEIVFNAEEEAT